MYIIRSLYWFRGYLCTGNAFLLPSSMFLRYFWVAPGLLQCLSRVDGGTGEEAIHFRAPACRQTTTAAIIFNLHHPPTLYQALPCRYTRTLPWFTSIVVLSKHQEALYCTIIVTTRTNNIITVGHQKLQLAS